MKEILKRSLAYRWLNKVRWHYRLSKGLKEYAKTGVTPDSAYQAMISLHGHTYGQKTRQVASQLASSKKAILPEMTSGVLGTLSKQDVQNIAAQIRRDGFYIFKERLGKEICDEITEYAFKTKSIVYDQGKPVKHYFNKENPEYNIYKLPESENIQQLPIQKLMADPSVRALAATYTNTTPVLCSVNTWFSPAIHKVAEGSGSINDYSAQQFHFDMSRTHWLNFFIYLTDVGPENGPHCYVKGSHDFSKKNEKARSILKRGYVRVSDDDIIDAYGKDKIVEILGKRGTIIAVDTIGFHKGCTPKKDYRLIFEMVFANSLFGGEYSMEKLPSKIHADLAKACHEAPETYYRYQTK